MLAGRTTATRPARGQAVCPFIPSCIRRRLTCYSYLCQILHGCKSSHCNTPTCLSAQKRDAPRPVRPPTQLTARALAHYLAGQDNPRQGLCPHELKISPASLEIHGAVSTHLQQTEDGSLQYGVYTSIWKLTQDRSNGPRVREGSRRLAQAPSTSHVDQHVVDAVEGQHQKSKDTKSLSQNLFDSVTMIHAYSKQLPSPASIIDTLRSSSAFATHTASGVVAADAEPQTQAHNTSHNVTAASHTNDLGDTPTLKRQPHIDRQHSQSNLRPRSHGQVPSSPAETRSNGEQVHRIPLSLRDHTSPVRGFKPANTSPEEAFDQPNLSIAKIGKKNFTLGTNTASEMGRVTPSIVTSSKIGQLSKPPARPDPALPVLSKLNCDTLEGLKDEVHDHRKHQVPDDFNFAIDYDTNGRYRPTKPFVNRSLFYTFSDPATLLKSFRDSNKAFEKSPLPHLDSAQLTHSFRDWNRRNGALIFDSLWIALEALYTHPPEMSSQKSPRLRPSRKGTSRSSSSDPVVDGEAPAEKSQPYLSNFEAAHIVMICIHALTSLVPVGWPQTWTQLRKFRSWGIVMPNAPPGTNGFAHPYIDIIDELEYEPAIRLAERLLGAIGARTCIEHILATIKKQDTKQRDTNSETTNDCLVDIIVQHLEVAERVALAIKGRMGHNSNDSEDPGWTITATLIEWLKTIITKKWDSKAQINRWSSVGTAVMMLDKLCKWHTFFIRSLLITAARYYKSLNLRTSMFEIPFFNERLDTVEEPLRFLTWEEQPNTLHILQYPVLFPADYLVRYFRTINFTSMMAQYDHTTRTHQMKRSFSIFLRDPHDWLINNRMKITLTEYLILNVSREEPLKDTFDQLWGVERRVLLKPLKVKMGQREGELGADHGGVTYEYFRVVMSEAFKPEHGNCLPRDTTILADMYRHVHSRSKDAYDMVSA